MSLVRIRSKNNNFFELNCHHCAFLDILLSTDTAKTKYGNLDKIWPHKYASIYPFIFFFLDGLTISKSSRTNFSDSPRYFEVSEALDTLKNVVLHSFATALAKSVLPVPGGPNIQIPRQGRRIPWKYSLNYFDDYFQIILFYRMLHW